jgi:hypothetical protein
VFVSESVEAVDQGRYVVEVASSYGLYHVRSLTTMSRWQFPAHDAPVRRLNMRRDVKDSNADSSSLSTRGNFHRPLQVHYAVRTLARHSITLYSHLYNSRSRDIPLPSNPLLSPQIIPKLPKSIHRFPIIIDLRCICATNPLQYPPRTMSDLLHQLPRWPRCSLFDSL